MKKNRILMLCIVCLTILNLCVFTQVAFTLFRLPSTKIDEANSAFSLELVGIAISVWIGLNVYNIISKEEVNEIAERAREALTQANFAQQNLEDNQKAIAVLYKEVFCSKLRSSQLNDAPYMLMKFVEAKNISSLTYQQLASCEEQVLKIYGIYSKQRNNLLENEHILLINYVNMLLKEIERNRFYASHESALVSAYYNIREGDILFYRLVFMELTDKKTIERNVNRIVCNYKKALFELFGTDNPDELKDRMNDITEERIVVCLANNIAGIYCVVNARNKDILQYHQKYECLEYARLACGFPGVAATSATAIYHRNRGVAYEMLYDESMPETDPYMTDAYDAYIQSYVYDMDNAKTAYCLAAWHRKALHKLVPEVDKITLCVRNEKTLPTFSPELEERIVFLLEQIIHWHSIQYQLQHKVDDRWINAYVLLERVQGKNYSDKIKEIQEKQLSINDSNSENYPQIVSIFGR